MLRWILALLVTLAAPVVAQSPRAPPAPEEIPPPCDHLYLLHLERESALTQPAEAIAEIFAANHARLDTQSRIVARFDADGRTLAEWTRARRRVATVRAVLVRFAFPADHLRVEFVAVSEAYLRGTVGLVEIVPPAEMVRRRAAWPLNIAC